MKNCFNIKGDEAELQSGLMVSRKKCDALRDLVPFVHFNKREKHPWKSVTFSKVALLHRYFSRFLKLHKWYKIVQSMTMFELMITHMTET